MKILSTSITIIFLLLSNMLFAQKKYHYIPIAQADSPSEIIRKAANVVPTSRQLEWQKDDFCLWPTKTTEHSVKNSPWKNGKGDIVKEVSDACKKYGRTFNLLSVQESITVGQRAEGFQLDYLKENNQWETRTTIGYKRLLKFNTITAKKVRLDITRSRLNPTISEIGLYKRPNI